MATEFNHFPQIAAGLMRELKKVPGIVAKDIAEYAAAGAPVDTHFLEASCYYSTPTKSTYGKGHVTMTPYQALHRELFPEVRPDNAMEAIAAVGATYGAFVNYGTRYMPARPFWEPALVIGQTSLEIQLSLIPGALGEIAHE